MAMTTSSSISVNARFALKVRNADLQIEIGVLTGLMLSHNPGTRQREKGVIINNGLVTVYDVRACASFWTAPARRFAGAFGSGRGLGHDKSGCKVLADRRH
jgi:hypothetical protein